MNLRETIRASLQPRCQSMTMDSFEAAVDAVCEAVEARPVLRMESPTGDDGRATLVQKFAGGGILIDELTVSDEYVQMFHGGKLKHSGALPAPPPPRPTFDDDNDDDEQQWDECTELIGTSDEPDAFPLGERARELIDELAGLAARRRVLGRKE